MSEPVAQDQSVSRRRFLKFAALAASAAAAAPALAACSSPTPSSPAPAASSGGSAPAPTQAPAAPAATAARVIPGQSGAAPAAAPAKPAGGKVTSLTFAQENSFIKQFDDYFTQTLAPAYEKETGIKLNFDGISVGGVPAKITAAIEAKNGPDSVMAIINYPQLWDAALIDVTDIAEDMGKRWGGWYENIKDAVVVNGKWKGLPLGNVGQMMVYRTDWFQQAGYDKFPDTWDELLEAGTKLKQMGHPLGFEFGHGFGDNHGWMYPLLWSFGAREVDKDGKTITLDSDETARAVDYVRKFFEQANLQDVLGWTDVNNNKAFLGEQISATNNAESILIVAKQDFPDIAKNIGHALNPKGPSGERFSFLNPWAMSGFTFSPDPGATKALLKWLTDEKQYVGRIESAKSYYQPFLKGLENLPMWNEEPRMQPFRESVASAHLPGWPGPAGRQASEVTAKYVIVDMFASAAQGKSTKEVIATAVGQLKQIYGVA